MSDSPFLPFSPILGRIREVIPADLTVHLVGGAVRDALLGRPLHDMDFVLPAAALSTARLVANALGGAYYPLDEARETGRVILAEPERRRINLDFSIQRGGDLISDLRARDFTINAMALDLDQSAEVFDPLGGAADLLHKQLRACLPSSFKDDPVRILRGIRFANAFQLHIAPDTLKFMKQSVPALVQVSEERTRDELFRILEGPQTAVSLRALEMLGVLPYILPEILTLRGLSQPPPHTLDAWEHTLDALKRLAMILKVLSPEYQPDSAASLTAGLIALRLGRFRQSINEMMTAELSVGRSVRGLLFLSAIYHDVAKPQTRQLDEKNRFRFHDHDRIGAEVIASRASELRFSNVEIEWLRLVVHHHMRPIFLANEGGEISRRAIYRFFRDTGEAGVCVCILSLADVWATYGAELNPQVWTRQVEVVRTLLEAWWERPQESVYPPAVVSGHDIIQEFGLKPGPNVGWLLESIREAQSVGLINDRRQALDFARELLDQEINHSSL